MYVLPILVNRVCKQKKTPNLYFIWDTIPLYIHTHVLTWAAVQPNLPSICSDPGQNCFQPASICHDKPSTQQFHFPAPTTVNFNIILSFPTFLDLTLRFSLRCPQLVTATPPKSRNTT